MRLCIFSFYNSSGRVEDYILYLLNELLTAVDEIWIVVNGIVDDDGKEKLSYYTDRLVLRNNEGYDAGAYKAIFESEQFLKGLDAVEEIVLCNDTFFGPFVSLKQIFNTMRHRKNDFWGLNYVGECIVSHIQSFFLVFKSSVFDDLIKYFKDNVILEETDIREIYSVLETGVFHYLKNKGFKWDTYCYAGNIDIYQSGNIAMKKFGLPILKKKFFSECKYEINIQDALHYIDTDTDYNVNLILDCIKNEYPETYRKIKDVNTISDEIVEVYMPERRVSDEAIDQYFSDGSVYIYGEGIIARKLYHLYEKYDSIKGFVVTDVSRLKTKSLYGFPIFEYDSSFDEKKIVVGLNMFNTNQIITKQGTHEKWLYLW